MEGLFEVVDVKGEGASGLLKLVRSISYRYRTLLGHFESKGFHTSAIPHCHLDRYVSAPGFIVEETDATWHWPIS